MKTLTKFLMWLFKVIVKWLKNKVTTDELLAEITLIMLDEITDLNNMTISELRTLAKSKGISLEGKRVKDEIIAIIEKHLGA